MVDYSPETTGVGAATPSGKAATSAAAKTAKKAAKKTEKAGPPATKKAGSNDYNAEVIQSYLNRYENLLDQKSNVGSDIKVLKQEMAENGLNPKAVIALHKLKEGRLYNAKEEQLQLTLEGYARAVGVTFEESSVLSNILATLKEGQILKAHAGADVVEIGRTPTGLWAKAHRNVPAGA